MNRSRSAAPLLVRCAALVGLAASLAIVGCASEKRTQSAPQYASATSPLERAAQLMTGRFDSSRQAARTAELPDEQRYLDIAVRMHRIHAWNDSADSIYLYVEQAVSSMPDRPYRQRVYKLMNEGAGRVSSRVLWLPEGSEPRFVGAGRDQSPFAELAPTDLDDRGCVVDLEYVAGDAGEWEFVGHTRGDGCPSDFRGAVRTTSEMRFAPDRFEAWDRGWNAADEQVWGPTAGPYVFDRVE